MKIVIIAGEVSGDIHGGKLVVELMQQNPGIEVSGIGGDQMVQHGFKTIYHIRQMAFLGIGEILKHLPLIRKVFLTLVNHVKKVKPEAVILIDYPGFNLRFAKVMHRLGVPVFYYISPQLWAWGKNRVKKIRKYVNKMLVIFPFEVEFYKKHGIDAEYVGHPLVDEHYDVVNPKSSNEPNERILGLLPGSRKHEIEKLLPDMLETAKILYEKNKIDQVLIAKVDNISDEVYKSIINKNYLFVKHFTGNTAEFFNCIDAALVKSGTSTLETAYFQVPFIIVYRVSKLTWFLGKIMVNLDSIGLANIVAGKKIAEELLQNDFTPNKAAELISELLNPEINKNKRRELKTIQDKLGEQGASKRVAGSILEFISERLK
jgi:lipid-A-disaccharide synthase